MEADTRRKRGGGRRDTTINRRRIKTLERRASFLDERIRNYRGHSKSRDVAEKQALEWALDVTKEWMADDPIFDYDWSGTEFTNEATDGEIKQLEGKWGKYQGLSVDILHARRIEDDENGNGVIRLTLRWLPQPRRLEPTLGFRVVER